MTTRDDIIAWQHHARRYVKGRRQEHHHGRCPRDESARFGCLCDLIGDVENDTFKELRAQVEALRSAQIVAGMWNGMPPHDDEWDGARSDAGPIMRGRGDT